MRKNFLKVALVGLLAFGMPAMITSCKDYDDDIENLDNKVADLQSQLNTVKTAVAAAQSSADAANAAAAAAAAAGNEAKAAAEAAKAAAAQAKADALQAVADQIAALDAKFVTKEELADVVSKLNGIDATVVTLQGQVNENTSKLAAMQTQIAALENYKNQINALVEQLGGAATLMAQYQQVVDLLAQLQNALPENVNLEDWIKQVSSIQQYLLTIQGKQLQGLVFQPALYVDGIEALEYNYTTYTLVKATANYGSNSALVQIGTTPEIIKVPGNSTVKTFGTYSNNTDDVNPVQAVSYAMNPSTANVADATFSYLTRDAEVVNTGRASAVAVAYAGTPSVNNGILTVGLTANGKQLENKFNSGTTANNGNDWATLFALQANLGVEADTVVTSDYARLVPTRRSNWHLAFASKSTPGQADAVDALGYNTPYCAASAAATTTQSILDAVGATPSVKVAYNGSVDLTKIVNLHYAYTRLNGNGNDANSPTVNGSVKYGILPYDDASTWNLAYNFELVYYTTGSNVTSDSKYAQINGTTLNIGTVDSNGNFVSAQNKAAIGREPLILVTVKDTNKGTIVAWGYIKVQIIGQDIINIEPFNYGEFYQQCQQTKNATWAQVSEKVLSALNISQTQFEALYTIEKIPGTNYAQQYSAPRVKAGQSVAKVADGVYQITNTVYGTIEVIANTASTQTSVLAWTLYNDVTSTSVTVSNSSLGVSIPFNPNDFQNIWLADNHTVTTYVKYVGQSSADDDIYVPLTATVVKPQGTLDNKLAVAWNAAMDQIGLNVTLPGNSNDLISANIYNIDPVTFPQVFSTDINFAFNGYPTFSLAPANNLWSDKQTNGTRNFQYVGSTLTGAQNTYNYYFTGENYFGDNNGFNIIKASDGNYYWLTVKPSSNPYYKLFGVPITGVYYNSTGSVLYQYSDGSYGDAVYFPDPQDELDYAIKALNISVYKNNVLYVAKLQTQSGSWKKDSDGYPVLNGAAQIFATIDGTGHIILEPNNYTKVLLNEYSSLGAAQGWPEAKLTANLGTVAIQNCTNEVFSVKDATFNGLFLRPINIVESNTLKPFINGATDGTPQDVWNMINLVDMRGETALDVNAWLWSYYNVTAVNVLGTGAQGAKYNYNGTWETLPAQLQFEQIGQTTLVSNPSVVSSATTAADKLGYDANGNPKSGQQWIDYVIQHMGKLVYKNQGFTVTKQFQVQLPVEVVYGWGSFKTTITVTVLPTGSAMP